jgi:hypothetical protein
MESARGDGHEFAVVGPPLLPQRMLKKAAVFFNGVTVAHTLGARALNVRLTLSPDVVG